MADSPHTDGTPPLVGRRTVLRAAGLAAAVPLVAACDAVDKLFALNTIRVAVTWSDAELAAFQSVVDAFEAANPTYQVDLIPLGDDIADALSSGTNGRPDVVMMPRPGLVTEHLDQLDPLPADVWDRASLSDGWQSLVWSQGVPYGLPFKVANQSALWYRKDLLDEHRLTAPTTWSEWLTLNDNLIRLGIAPLALGAGDGWPLSAFFDNVLLGCQPRFYAQLSQSRSRVELWRRPEFTQALRLLGAMLSVEGALSGGVDRALALQFPDAVVEVFGYHRAAMVVSADFAEPIITEFRRPPGNYAVVPFPRIDGTDAAHVAPVVIGADIAVLPAPSAEGARAFVRWLAGPEAPLPWIRGHGGFIAADRRTPTTSYSPWVGELATAVRTPTLPTAVRPTFAFDLSDELGSLGGSGALWQVLEDFLRTVGDGRGHLVDTAAATAADRMHDIEAGHGR
jgi:alpha-glucoside transport system substrate-binding protein